VGEGKGRAAPFAGDLELLTRTDGGCKYVAPKRERDKNARGRKDIGPPCKCPPTFRTVKP